MSFLRISVLLWRNGKIANGGLYVCITSEQSSIQPATIQDFHHPHYSPLLDYTGLNSSITAAQRHWCRVDKSGFTGTSFDEASCQNLQTTSTRGLKDWKPEKLGNIELS
nr:hypothetical protein CFP56_60461 [Quercus suber]